MTSNITRRFAKAVRKEKVTPLTQETLTGRLLFYLNVGNEPPVSVKNVTEIMSSVRQKTNYLQNLNSREIVDFSTGLPQANLNKTEQLAVIEYLDKECPLRLPNLKTDDIFKILNVYMCIVPNRISECKFYNSAIGTLYKSVNVLNKRELLQLIFYMGLRKKSFDVQQRLDECVKRMSQSFLSQLTSEELCIICNALFKTSTKVTNKALLNKVRDYLNDNLIILKDTALFITLLKTIRHNKYQDHNLLATISCAIFFNKTVDSYSFPIICHIMALFADYYYYDENLCKIFAKKCLEELSGSCFVSKNAHLTEQLRGKDIKRFLWVLSIYSDMRLISPSDVENVIMPKLLERIKLKNDVDSVVEIFLYLWMLNYRPYELVPYLFSTDNIQHLENQSKNKWKLNFLLHVINCEDTDLAAKLPVKPLKIPNNVSDYQLRSRSQLLRLLSNLKLIHKQLDIEKFELSREVPHLNIIGITGYTKRNEKAVYVELLDEFTSLKNIESTPTGMMALKLRLLDQTNEGLLVISTSDIADITDAELCDNLIEELKLIC